MENVGELLPMSLLMQVVFFGKVFNVLRWTIELPEPVRQHEQFVLWWHLKLQL